LSLRDRVPERRVIFREPVDLYQILIF